MNTNAESQTGISGISQELASIWTEVLGVPVEANDDFFELGGDSISATHIMQIANESFNTEFPMTLIVNHSRLSELAAELEKILNGGVE